MDDLEDAAIAPEDEVARICADLIRIESVNYGDGSGPGERKAAEYVMDQLTEVGLDPVLVESGTATENRPYFDKVNTAFFAANGRSDGRSIIDNLIAAGFRKQDMEVTPDRTSIDLDADSVIFSVRVKGECLIGQFSAMGYSTIQAPLLGTGGCLVGATRPIDW